MRPLATKPQPRHSSKTMGRKGVASDAPGVPRPLEDYQLETDHQASEVVGRLLQKEELRAYPPTLSAK